MAYADLPKTGRYSNDKMRLYEILNDDQNIVATLSMEDLEGHLAAQGSSGGDLTRKRGQSRFGQLF